MDAPNPLNEWIETHSTVIEFAREVECSAAHLRNIIAGRKRPSIDLLARISDRTGGVIGLETFQRESA